MTGERTITASELDAAIAATQVTPGPPVYTALDEDGRTWVHIGDRGELRRLVPDPPKTVTRSEVTAAIEIEAEDSVGPGSFVELENDGDQLWATVAGERMLVVDDPTPARFDFPRALASFLNRDDVYRELQKATTDPLGLRDALLAQAWALEPDDPADGSPIPGR